MTVEHAWVGAPTADGATVVAVITGTSARLAVSADAQLTSPTFFGPQSPDAGGAVRLVATGLASSQRWWWAVEEDGDISPAQGTFRTLPPVGQPASYTIGVVGDAGQQGTYVDGRVSNHPIFDTLRQRAVDEDWLQTVHLGDSHYLDIGDDNHITYTGPETYREAYDRVLTFNNTLGLDARQGKCWRHNPIVCLWDDHDFGPNNSDRTSPGRDDACTVYRERAPHYDLPAGAGANPIHQSWQIGRVLFIGSDVRADRDPNDDPDDETKTMLGSDQMAWLEGLLADPPDGVEFLIWCMPKPFPHPPGAGGDSWGSFSHERDEIMGLLRDHGWLGRMLIISADAHILALDAGSLWHEHGHERGAVSTVNAALEANPSDPGDHWDHGWISGIGQYGTVTVTDIGSSLTVTWTGWRGTEQLMTYSVGVAPSTVITSTATVRDLAPLVPGAHRMLAEARVVIDGQSGDDPDGQDLPILTGDVQLDGTAEVRGTLQMETLGIDPDTGRPRMPRRPSDLLAPYGNEVFVRRGVDAGGQRWWSPLGYFRIESAEQDGDSDSPIRLAGQDRMGGIVEADLLAPREYPASTSIATVFADLIGDVHPDALVVFDDSSGFDALGRRLVVDEARYDALAELADALGKVFYVDGEGAFRIEDAPDDDDVIWQARAGRDGVLISSARRVTRQGAYNAVIATGEGADQEDPVRGVAIDAGPTSPTRWGGPFGRVPTTIRSPAIRTVAQAERAAREKLRRSLGAPASADFSAVPNPALRPGHVVRVVAKDGTRDVHRVETVTIPLTPGGELTATTRQQTQVIIGSEVTS